MTLVFCSGPFACTMYGVVGSIFGVASIWTMVFIALDRYNVIVKVCIQVNPLELKLCKLTDL